MDNTERSIKDLYFRENGIPYESSWDMKRVRAATKLICGFWIDKIDSYEIINKQLQENTRFDEQKIELQEWEWEQFTDPFNEGRDVVYDSLLDYGLCEPEAHFLRVKWCLSTIKKFFVLLHKEISGKKRGTPGAKEPNRVFMNTKIRQSVEILEYRYRDIAVKEKYVWSKKATETSAFRKQASFVTAQEIIDSGIALTAKLTM